jgi:hypothetical protein
MQIPYDRIVEHALSTRFVVNDPIYQDPKEEEDSSQNPKAAWPHIKPGFTFTPDCITFREFGLSGSAPGIGFWVEVSVPNRWIDWGWMAGGDHDADPDLEVDWYIDAEDLVNKCDEARPHH